MKKIKSPPGNENHHTLESFCHDSSSLWTKIALLTFYKVNYPFWIEKSILLFEYLQLMSQAFLSTFESSKQNRYFFEIITYILKLVNPCYLLSYNDSMTSTVLVMLFCCTLLKLLLFANVIETSIRNKPMNSWLLCLWRWIYKLQTRVLYFLFTSFWIKTIIETQENSFNLFGMGKSLIIFIASLVLVIEFLFSLLLETQLCYFLPTKNFLSAKNYQLQMTTFLQKSVIQIALLMFKSHSETLNWIIPILGIIIDLRRFYEFFFEFPLYYIKALILQGTLLSTIFSLDISKFVQIVLQSINYPGAGINFVIITWILLALLINKISHEVLNFQILSLISTKIHRKNAYLLLHKITITKELQKDQKIPTSETSNFSLEYLVSVHQCTNLEGIFGIKTLREQIPELKLESISEISKETMNKIFLLYCQKLSKKYPKNSLVKLHTAFQSFKNAESHTKVIKMTTEIQNRRWPKNSLGSSLLLHDIEKSILENVQQQQKNEHSLDFSTYIKSTLLVNHLKKGMLEQANLNLQIFNNMLNNTCDIEEIHSCAQKISSIKSLIQKNIDELSLNLSEHFISPYLLYAEYHLVANHSKDNFEKYHETYMQKYFKAQKGFQEPSLQEENLYQDSNALVLISTQKNEFGKILYCNNSLVDLCGGHSRKLYEGSNISILFPSILKDYYSTLFRQYEETGSMNKIHRAFIYNKEDHLVEVDFCFKYHPYLTQGLCLNMIIRPVPATENIEFLLLSENEQIEGASKNLSKILGFPSTILSIKEVSEELYLMNNAANKIIQKKKMNLDFTQNLPSKGISRFMRAKSILQSPNIRPKFPEISYTEANEIYNTFTSEGREIYISYHQSRNSREKFHSIVQIIEYGSLTMKFITLQKIDSKHHKERGEEYNEFDLEENCRPIFTEHPKSPLEIHVETLPMESEKRRLVGMGGTDFSQAQSPRLKLVPSPRFQQNPNMSYFDSNLEMTESTRIGHFEMSYIKRKNPKYFDTQSSMERRSIEKAENKIFRKAILSKSYPKSFTTLCFVFYLIILMTFAGQIIMKTESDKTMEDLQIKKTLLKDSEEKNYKGALIQIGGRGILLQILNLITVGGAYLNMISAVGYLQVRIHDMKEANDRMLDYIHTLDKETQDKLSLSNVRVDGTYLDSEDEIYQYVDIFQITDEIANAVKTFSKLPHPSNRAGYHISNYLTINLVNDFLYQSAKITEVLTKAVEDQKEFLESITNLFLALNPLLLTGIGILLCCIIWNQYRIEKQNMKAFIKIPSEGVKKIHHRLSQFQQSLINEESFEKKWHAKTRQDLHLLYKRDPGSAYSKKAETQRIKYKAFKKKYSKYIVRVILCISFLVAITLWDLVTTRQAIEIIYNRQGQLQFANYISNRVMVTHITFVELFCTNNTQIVEHEDAFEGLVKKAKLLKEIQSEISTNFLEVDGTYNQEVREIIFENNPKCKGFVSSFGHYCELLVEKGQPVNMIVAIASLQSLIELKIQEFLKVDRSKMENLQTAIYWTETPLTYSLVIAEEAHKIADIMDASITEKMTEMKNLKTTIIIIFSTSLLIVSILIWLYILKVIREVYNDFKKVLQTLPPNLVLSSYLLKRFLQTTSNTILFEN